MTTVKEIQIQSVGEPYSVKIERNSKGYNYEISVKSDSALNALEEIGFMRQRLERELYGGDAPRLPNSSSST